MMYKCYFKISCGLVDFSLFLLKPQNIDGNLTYCNGVYSLNNYIYPNKKQ